MSACPMPSAPGWYLLTPAGWAGPYPSRADAAEAGRSIGMSSPITRQVAP